MKTRIIKKFVPALALLALVASLSSCHRGMGCPYNSISDTAVEVVKEVVDGQLSAVKDVLD